MEDFKKRNAENHENASPNETDNLNASAEMTEETSIPVEMTEELDSLRNDLTEQKEKYLRLYAEFDNFKRRNARERVELLQTAGKEVIVSLLDILDDFDRAQAQLLEVGEPNDAVKEGVLLIFNKFRGILTAKGLKPMDCKGHDFNPDEHEAVSQIPVTDDKLRGKVIDELVKGYYLNEKIIRFAKVVVGL